MPFPVRICVICEVEFELKPGKPGFANCCLECSAPKPLDSILTDKMSTDERKVAAEANEARRAAMRNLLYRKDS